MCKGVQGCARVCKNVQGCARMCKGVQGCIRMCKNVQGCIRMCKNVQGCARMCKNVQGCARVCKDVQECARMCKGVQGCARVCKGLQGCARVSQTVVFLATQNGSIVLGFSSTFRFTFGYVMYCIKSIRIFLSQGCFKTICNWSAFKRRSVSHMTSGPSLTSSHDLWPLPSPLHMTSGPSPHLFHFVYPGRELLNKMINVVQDPQRKVLGNTPRSYVCCMHSCT